MNEVEQYFSGTIEYKRELKFDFIMLVLIFFSCAIFVIENSNPSTFILKYTRFLDYLFNIIFSIEVIFKFAYSDSKTGFFKSGYNLIDILAILPFWFGFGNFVFLRALRFIRIFRFLRFFKFSKKFFSEHGHDTKSEREHILRYQKLFFLKTFFSIFLFIFIFSSVIYYIEVDKNPLITQFSDSLYFVWISVLAVGYGDITPVTQIGKIITMIGTLIGVSIIPFQLGNFIRITNDRKRLNKNEVKVKYKYCPHCGEEIIDEIEKKVILKDIN